MLCCRSGLSKTAKNASGQKSVILEAVNVLNDEQKRNYHEVVGDIITPSQVMGIDHLRDPRLNKVTKLHINI